MSCRPLNQTLCGAESVFIVKKDFFFLYALDNISFLRYNISKYFEIMDQKYENTGNS